MTRLTVRIHNEKGTSCGKKFSVTSSGQPTTANLLPKLIDNLNIPKGYNAKQTRASLKRLSGISKQISFYIYDNKLGGWRELDDAEPIPMPAQGKVSIKAVVKDSLITSNGTYADTPRNSADLTRKTSRCTRSSSYAAGAACFSIGVIGLVAGLGALAVGAYLTQGSVYPGALAMLTNNLPLLIGASAGALVLALLVITGAALMCKHRPSRVSSTRCCLTKRHRQKSTYQPPLLTVDTNAAIDNNLL